MIIKVLLSLFFLPSASRSNKALSKAIHKKQKTLLSLQLQSSSGVYIQKMEVFCSQRLRMYAWCDN